MSRLVFGWLALSTALMLLPGPASGQPQAPAADPAPATPEKSPGPGLVGQWTWKWQDGEQNTHHHLLVIEGVPPKYAARERFDDLPPVAVTRLVVQGRQVSFTVQRGNRTSTYVGTLADNDTINGEVTVVGQDGQAEKFTWTAQRAPKPTPAKGEAPTPPAEGENPGATGKTEKP